MLTGCFHFVKWWLDFSIQTSTSKKCQLSPLSKCMYQITSDPHWHVHQDSTQYYFLHFQAVILKRVEDGWWWWWWLHISKHKEQPQA